MQEFLDEMRLKYPDGFSGEAIPSPTAREWALAGWIRSVGLNSALIEYCEHGGQECHESVLYDLIRFYLQYVGRSKKEI